MNNNNNSTVALTKREQECLFWLAEGLQSQGIAERLGISVKTVEKHIFSARKRLGAKTRAHAVALALKMQLIPQKID